MAFTPFESWDARLLNAKDYPVIRMTLKRKIPKGYMKITPSQLRAIVNAADSMSAMRGCGDDDTEFNSIVRGIDNFLKSNGLKRSFT